MNDQIIRSLFAIITSRKQEPQEKSYTNYLFNEGIDKIGKKVGEEAMELVIAAKNNDRTDTVNETADLLYHIFVLLVNQNIEIEEILDELEKRSEKMGNLKEKHQKGEY